MGETGAVHLTHHHGLGNDFLIGFVDEIPADGADLARRLCDRSTGLGAATNGGATPTVRGADGLVFGTTGDNGRPVFTLFNSDGSRAEVSGNGLRCFGQALVRREGVADLDVVVDTPAGPRRIEVRGGPADDEVQATVEMGNAGPGPTFDGLDLGLVGAEVRHAGSVDVGNPHLVLVVDDPDAVDLAVVGPAVEAHFAPVGCNVHLVAVESRSAIRLRPWERGAGLTEACGSGACAAAHVAHQWGLVDDVVEVRMPGGSATVAVGRPIRLTGPATWTGDAGDPGDGNSCRG